MKMRHIAAACVAACLVESAPAAAQAQRAPDRAAWSAEELHGPAVPLKLTVDEGTWMSLDVSPDGRTIVFDILGDLYRVPITGGGATRITSGIGWDAAPRFSPDGKRIVFISDRSGSEQLWLVSAAGGAPTQMTKDAANQYASPAWAPDGEFVLAYKKANAEGGGTRSAVVLLNVGGGTGLTAIDGAANSAAPSPDGRWLYYQSGTSIMRMDRQTGDKVTIVAGYEAVHRPAVSHNGRYLAYSATIDAVRTLRLRDLESGADRALYRGLDWLESWGGDDLDYLPGYSFTPDDQAIVLAANGKIRRVDVATGAATIIPFTAEIDQTLTQKVYFRGRIKDDPVRPKVLHWMQPVTDNRVVFSAAGKLYLYDNESARATPFAEGPGLQYAPAVSPDGRWIAYVNWTDTLGGFIRKAPVDGGASVALSTRAGRFQNLSWSPDGRRLAVAEERQSADWMTTINYDLLLLDAERGGAPQWVTTGKSRGERKAVPRPTFDQRGERLFYSEPDSGAMQLYSIDLAGKDRRTLAKSKNADEMFASPDGKWLAFTERQDAYTAPLPPANKDVADVTAAGGAVPVYRLTTEGADYLYWLDGGKTLVSSWGPKMSRFDMSTVGTAATPTRQVTTVSFELPRAQGKGSVLLKNARIVTMKGGRDEVIERGDILVENSRISAVGRSGQVKAPAGATTMDMSGKTIIPGLIDLHAHYSVSPGMTGVDVYPEQNTELLANLAFGVTTWRDPSARSQTLFTLGEMVEAGTTLGPRIFSTGDIFFVSERACCGQARSLDDARGMVRRQKALGATWVKEHTDPKREQVQWIIQAAREESLMVAVDPTRGPRHELRPLMDGATSLEHLYAVTPVKKDVLSVFTTTGGIYVPTLIISTVEDFYMTSTMNPHDDAKVRRFIPHFKLDRDIHQYSRWRMPAEWPSVRHAEVIRDLVRAGGKVGLGSHGQVQGIGAHWELWGLASGGLTPLEALRLATVNGAEALGYQDDLGSIEAGKLADLVVLNKNPLTDLKNTTSIAYVMKGGMMWNGDTMDEVWPAQKKRPRAAWEDR